MKSRHGKSIRTNAIAPAMEENQASVKSLHSFERTLISISPESVTPERRSAQAIDSSLLPKNFNEPVGAPAIFEKRIEIRLLHPASTEEATDSG
jgi:hypothetical protein